MADEHSTILRILADVHDVRDARCKPLSKIDGNGILDELVEDECLTVIEKLSEVHNLLLSITNVRTIDMEKVKAVRTRACERWIKNREERK